MPHITEDIYSSTVNFRQYGTCTATRTFIISGLVGNRIPRRGQGHPENETLLVRKRWVDRKRSRRGAIVVNVLYA